MDNWAGFPKTPKYTDGTLVATGDSVRYKQAPGGILPESDSWTYGVVSETDSRMTTHVLAANDGRFYNLQSHIIERA